MEGLRHMLEYNIQKRLTELVDRETQRLESLEEFDAKDAMILEKMCKCFQILSANTRENLKAGLLEKLTEEQLEEILKDG